ncbi:serine/threonine-protein kinase-like protein CCR4 [Salvia miltiorrhiza]|uniref:serine/threonine-protein kinase-like protein CCR4 n=1 Tax=Salvia miltiorrhiza TaxID=226208 RepID=UPI0025AB93CA|nr:serine/threonine-protein kinase-like protein CCR4 [Salvia miltiorrhiza]
MAMNVPLLCLLLISLLPFSHSLSPFAISETNDQTLICALVKSQDSSFALSCTLFPQRAQINLTPAPPSLSAIAAGDGFLCALSSSHSTNRSLIFCWRFSDATNPGNRKRVYNGSVLTDLSSANSRFCGVRGRDSAVECWPIGSAAGDGGAFASSLAVGEDFMCGLSASGEVACSGSDRNVADDVPVGRFNVVAAGFHRACGVRENGSLECWGGNLAGEAPEGEFKSVAVGEDRVCAIRTDERVVCWGEEGFSLPPSLRNVSFVSIQGKRKRFCGVDNSNYSLLCWGDEVLDSDSFVFDGVVPLPCRPREECGCDCWPNYGEYCGDRGLVMCQPCGPLLPPLLPPSSGGKKWNSKMVAFMVVGCFGTLSSLVVLCVFLFSRYIKIRGSRIHDSGRLEEGEGEGTADPPLSGPRPALEKKLSHLISMGNGGHLEEFSFQVLLMATDNFSEELRIGSGSFGSVYRATLEDGRQVAVKRAESSTSSSYAIAGKRGQEDRDIAFVNELEFLSRLNHKNLVRLLGYCEESNELALVYEYVDNGTLADHLHRLESSLLVSWPRRIKVALDAARGIEYLHEYAVPRIIHRDIKPSNILLDAMGNAKVSDFGLSLWGPEGDESHLSLRAAGTMGYMDPEYYRLQLLTTKSDVYSFGVVLLELISGCKAIHKNELGEPRNVVDYVVPYIIQDDIHRVLDRRVAPPTPFEIEAVMYVGYLAADCVMPEGSDRPTMSEVVNSLERALEACLAPQVLSRSTSVSSE